MATFCRPLRCFPKPGLRSFHNTDIQKIPFPLLGVIPFIAKNLTLWNVYLTLNSYGWHRVYRTALRSSKVLVEDKHDRQRLESSLKEALRFPSRAISILEQSHVSNFLHEYLQQQGTKNVPFQTDDKVITALDTLLQKIFPLYNKVTTFRKNIKTK